MQEVNKKQSKDDEYIYFVFKGSWYQRLNNLMLY